MHGARGWQSQGAGQGGGGQGRWKADGGGGGGSVRGIRQAAPGTGAPHVADTQKSR